MPRRADAIQSQEEDYEGNPSLPRMDLHVAVLSQVGADRILGCHEASKTRKRLESATK
jgi:hypothetical protein